MQPFFRFNYSSRSFTFLSIDWEDIVPIEAMESGSLMVFCTTCLLEWIILEVYGYWKGVSICALVSCLGFDLIWTFPRLTTFLFLIGVMAIYLTIKWPPIMVEYVDSTELIFMEAMIYWTYCSYATYWALKPSSCAWPQILLILSSIFLPVLSFIPPQIFSFFLSLFLFILLELKLLGYLGWFLLLFQFFLPLQLWLLLVG